MKSRLIADIWSLDLLINDNKHLHVFTPVLLVERGFCSAGLCLLVSALFCSEENVWKLCEFVREEKAPPLEDLFVVFISNANRTVRTSSLWETAEPFYIRFFSIRFRCGGKSLGAEISR